MARWQLLLLLGLLALAAVIRVNAEDAPAAAETDAEDAEDDEESDYSEADRAHLIVRKYFKDELGVSGRNLTVYIEVHNAGTATASDVLLVDGVDAPTNFSLVDGPLTTSLGKIEPGEAATHSYVLLPSTGSFAFEPAAAEVTYVAEIDSKDKQTAASSSYAIYIMTPTEQIQRYALIAGSYATLNLVTSTTQWRNLSIVAALVGLLYVGTSANKSYWERSTERARAKALAELEKEE